MDEHNEDDDTNSINIIKLNPKIIQLAISTMIGVRVGRKQTERFACKYHTSWASLEPQSAGNQLLFPGSKLLINSPYRIRGLPEFAVCLPPTSAPYNRGNCHL